MTDSVLDVLESDAALDALADRTGVSSADPVLRALSAWTAEIDARPCPALPRPAPASSAGPGLRGWRLAIALAAALTMSSSGLAAAVTGDPLTPLEYVVKKVHRLAPTAPGHGRDLGLGDDALSRRYSPPERPSRGGGRELLGTPARQPVPCRSGGNAGAPRPAPATSSLGHLSGAGREAGDAGDAVGPRPPCGADFARGRGGAMPTPHAAPGGHRDLSR